MFALLAYTLITEIQPVKTYNINQIIFIYLEVMDEREHYNKLDNFVDIKAMYDRAFELKDAPPLHYHNLFNVSRDELSEALIFNRMYRSHIQNILALYPNNNQLINLLEDTDKRYKLLDLARDSKIEHYYIHIRKRALKKLKEELDKIDPDLFKRGWLPVSVAES